MLKNSWKRFAKKRWGICEWVPRILTIWGCRFRAIPCQGSGRPWVYKNLIIIFRIFSSTLFQYDMLAVSYLNSRQNDGSNPFTEPSPHRTESIILRGALNRSEGPSIAQKRKQYPLFSFNKKTWIGFLVQPATEQNGRRVTVDPHNSLGASMFGMGQDLTHTDMAVSALYLHSLHQRQVSGFFVFDNKI